MKLAFVFMCMAVATHAFELPSLPSVFKPPTGRASVAQLKKDLLEAVSFTNNGKSASPEKQARVLQIVGEIEQAAPPSDTLLSDPREAKKLDGVWYLQYTSPSSVGDKDQFPNAYKPQYASEGDANIETVQVKSKGSVAAAGISVDTSNRVVKQIIDVPASKVTNDVSLDFGRVVVGGPFRQSPFVPNRAVVSFDTADITLKNGFTVKLGFFFNLVRAIRGSKGNGWLETTYLDDNVRIGRGNKGTMFVLTRDPDAVKP